MVKEFHALPANVKNTLKMRHHNKANPNVYRGLAPFLDNDPSHKELFDTGLPWSQFSADQHKYRLVERTPYPEESEYRHLQEGYERHFSLFMDLSLQLLSYLALGLGKHKDFFRPWFEKNSLSTFRSIYYLPRDHEDAASSSKLTASDLKLTTPEHADSGFLTLLTTFGYPGLQVLIDDEYRTIKPEPNCLVINLGETFQRITNFKVKATMHRVLDIGKVRYSSPFFLEPCYDVVIPSNMLVPEEE